MFLCAHRVVHFHMCDKKGCEDLKSVVAISGSWIHVCSAAATPAPVASRGCIDLPLFSRWQVERDFGYKSTSMCIIPDYLPFESSLMAFP